MSVVAKYSIYFRVVKAPRVLQVLLALPDFQDHLDNQVG